MHPLGDDFKGLTDFVPERYGKATQDKAIAAVPIDVLRNGPLLYAPRAGGPRFAPSPRPGCGM